MADQQQLTEQEFNAIAERVMAKLPRDTDEAGFNKAIDDAVSQAQASRARTLRPVASRGTGFSTANQKANATAVSESAPEIGGMVGGALGSAVPGVGNIGGAALGGSAGSLLRDAARKYRGAPDAPTSLKDVALGAGWEGGKQGALGVAGEGVGWAAGKVGNVIANRGVPLVRSALKIPLALARQRAGIEGVTPDIAANRMAKFIVDEGLPDANAARALIKKTGSQVDEATKAAEANPNVSPVLDTANRIPQYLRESLKRIEKQYLPRGGRTAVQDVGKELVEDSPLSQYVSSTARPSPKPPTGFTEPSLTKPGLTKPSFTEAPITEIEAGARPRALRANVRPSEALETIREKSFFDPASSEASRLGKKTIERATRDSFKDAVPDAAKPLLRQGRAMDAERVLDRAAWRDAGRDQFGFGPVVGAAAGHPGMGMMMQLLKGSQLRAGIAAPRVGQAIAGAGANSAQIARAASLLDQILSQQPPE